MPFIFNENTINFKNLNMKKRSLKNAVFVNKKTNSTIINSITGGKDRKKPIKVPENG